MNVLAIILALCSAVAWGTSDFLGGVKNRTVPILSVLLLSQASALVMLTIVVVVEGGGHPEGGRLGYAAIAGMAEVLAVGALYRGIAAGSASIVAPVAAAAPIVPLMTGALGGEVPSGVQWFGVLLAFAGPVLAASESSAGHTRRLLSVGAGAVAAGGFGVFFVAIDAASTGGGVPWVLLTARLTSIALIIVAVLATRTRPVVEVPDLLGMVLIGVLIVAGDTMYALATTEGMLGLVAVLSALHTVVTVSLAGAYLRDPIGVRQRIGIAVSLCGVAAITAS